MKKSYQTTLSFFLAGIVSLTLVQCGSLNISSPSSPVVPEKEYSIADFNADNQKIEIAAPDAAALSGFRAALKKTIGNEAAGLENQKNELVMKYFAMALAKSLKHPDIRTALKDEVAKQFDGDKDALWQTIGSKLVNSQTIADLLCSRLAGKNSNLITAADFAGIQLLNIYIFNMEKWDGKTIPTVALFPITVDDISVNTFQGWDCDLNEKTLDAKNPPANPVIVIGLNERVDPATMKLKGDFNGGALLKPAAVSNYYIKYAYLK